MGRISDFIEATNAAETTDEVFCLYEKAVAEFGFDRIMYSVLLPHPLYDSINSPSVMKNYPDDWIKYYVEQGFVIKDPVRKHCSITRLPFTWKSMMSKMDLVSEEKRVMVEGEEAGLNDGIAIPLHGPYGELFGVGMASSNGGADPAAHLSSINLLTVQFHNAFLSLDQPDRVNALPIRLTPREREVLLWCMKGKSNWVIGEILNISEHGVDFHMRNILSKLKTDSRITAIVKAIRLGMISP